MILDSGFTKCYHSRTLANEALLTSMMLIIDRSHWSTPNSSLWTKSKPHLDSVARTWTYSCR